MRASLRSGAPLLALLAAGCNCDGDPELGTLRPRITAKPNPLVFGPVFVGVEDARPLDLGNSGSADLEISGLELEPGTTPGFTVPTQGLRLGPNETRTILVVLVAAAEGPVTGALLIRSNDPETPVLRVPLSAEAGRRPGPALALCAESAELGLARSCAAPLTVNLGQVPVGSSVRAAIIVGSVGDRPLDVGAAGPAPGSDPSFRFTPPNLREVLAPQTERPIEVVLEPAAPGALRATYQVTSDDPARPSATVELVAEGVRSALCALPPLVDFATVALGQTARRTLELENCGQTPIELESLALEGNTAEFMHAALAGPVALAPGARHAVELLYTPADRGRDQGRLRAVADAGTALVQLVGQTETCELLPNPTTLSFGAVGIGQSRARSLLLVNSGAAACSVLALRISGSSEFSLSAPPGLPASVAPGGSLTIDLAYTPADAGMDSGALALDSDDPARPTQTVALDGRRLELGECQLEAMPDPVAFGVVPLGMRRTQGVVVRNAGSRACTILQVGTGAMSSPAFAAAGGPALPLLLAGATFTVDVSFAPRQVGPASGTLEIRTGITSVLSFPLSGTGSGARLCATPNPVVFGSHPMGFVSQQTVTLSSCGSDPVVVSGLSLAAPTSTEFSLVSPPATPLTLPVGATQLVELRYQGVDPGRDDGILRLTSNDTLEPTQDLQLVAASGPTCGDILGKICGLGGTGPVPGATVYVDTPQGRIQTTTNNQGDFVLTCLPVGPHTVHAEAGSWSTSFPATVVDQQVTHIPGQQCLDPTSARVAVVWGEWDQIQGILDVIGVPYTFYGELDQGILLTDPSELAQYDIVFLNCGFHEGLVTQNPGLLQSFVANGGSVYASDWAYDALEVGWPMFVDYYQDDAVRDDAQSAGNFSGLVDVLEPSLQAALQGQTQVPIASCCTAMDSAGAGTTVYLRGDRLNDGGQHPFFVGFSPAPGAGTVMYTDFHNSGQSSIEAVFRWLINRL